MKRMHVFAPLALAGATCAGPAWAQDYANLGASLFGENIPGGGAEDAAAEFNGEIDYRRMRLCYYLEIEELDDPTSVAIHQDAEGDLDPETLALSLPAVNGDEVCVTAEAGLLRMVGDKPDDYFLLVRSGSHPDGAIRGDLHD